MAKTIIKNTMEDPIEMTCEDCQSVFTYNYQDICRDKGYSILGYETVHRYVVCPVCKHDNSLTVLAPLNIDKIVKEGEE